MEDTLAEELAKKESIISRLIAVSSAQNEAIKNGETEKAVSFDAEKHGLIGELSEMDNSIKPFIIKNRKYPREIQDFVKKIDDLLNKLIGIEKENEKLLNEKVVSVSGKHIEAYKKAGK